MPFDKQVIRTRRRTLALQVRQDGLLVIRAPYFLKESTINRFVEQKRSWIDKVMLRMQERQRQQQRYHFQNGGRYLYLGVEHPLSFEGDVEAARFRFQKWYQQEARRVLTERCQLYASQMGVCYRSMALSGAKSRWGCCTPEGTLRFCWRLIMAPLHIIDYVVVHELAHLKELNHSRRFWSHVAAHHPGYVEAKKWLKDNGQQLSW